VTRVTLDPLAFHFFDRLSRALLAHFRAPRLNLPFDHLFSYDAGEDKIGSIGILEVKWIKWIKCHTCHKWKSRSSVTRHLYHDWGAVVGCERAVLMTCSSVPENSGRVGKAVTDRCGVGSRIGRFVADSADPVPQSLRPIVAACHPVR